MFGMIQIIGKPDEGQCTCWQGLELPLADYSIQDERVINALTKEPWNHEEDGCIVATALALLVLASARSLKRGIYVRDCISPEEYPYMFFPIKYCHRMTYPSPPKPIMAIMVS